MRSHASPGLPSAVAGRLLISTALAVGLAACVTDPEEPVTYEGAISYIYAGEVNGSIEIAGTYSVPTSIEHSYAFAQPTVQGDKLGIFASHHRGDQIVDILYLLISIPTEPGTHPIEDGNLAYGLDGIGTHPEHDFQFESGQVHIASHDGERIQGSFTASGEAHGGPGWDPFNPARPKVEISSGSFDLPVLRLP